MGVRVVKPTTDWMRFFEESRAELEASDHSNDELLEELRGLIRNSRLSLPTYRRVQEARRYAMTVEDLEILEDTYKQLANDESGLFEREDFIDAVVQARGTYTVITDVMVHGMGDGAKTDLALAQADAAQHQGKGCVVALVASAATIAGVVALVTALA